MLIHACSVGSTVKMCRHEPWRGKLCVTVEAIAPAKAAIIELIFYDLGGICETVDINTLILLRS